MERYATWPLRIALGAVFMLHGLPKLTNTAGVASFFGSIGIPMPYASALLVGIIEMVGGFLILTGYFTRIAGALLAAVMVVAILTAKVGKGFVGGWEFDAVLLAACISLVLAGPASSEAKILAKPTTRF